MSAFQALQTYAEVSATLIGLIAVIVVLRDRNEKSRARIELFEAIDFLLPGLMATIAALIAIALLASFEDEVFAWRLSHALFGLIHLAGPITFWTRPPETRVTFSITASLFFGTGSILIIVANFTVALGFLLEIAQITYFVGLTWVMLVSIWRFGSTLVNQGDA